MGGRLVSRIETGTWNEGPTTTTTTTPPAPERKMTPVVVAGVGEVESGRCKKPGTLPLGSDETFIESGLDDGGCGVRVWGVGEGEVVV